MMQRLSTLAFRNLWARKARTLLTACGITLGVATIMAIGITSATTDRSLVDFFAQISGRANLTVKDARDKPFRQRALRDVAATPGVQLAVPSIWKGATILVSDEELDITLVGIDPELDPQVRSYSLEAGRFISDRDRVYTLMLVEKFAEEHNIALGGDLLLWLPTDDAREETFTVVGLLADEGAGHLAEGTIGFVRLDVAQELYNQERRVDQIDLVVEPAIADSSQALEQLKEDLQEALGEEYTVSYPAAIGQSITEAMTGLRTGLGIFSVIALFVGAMLIYNTFAMTVAERTREIGMLRAMGATRGQVLRLVLSEAILMGFGGSLLGLAGGLALSLPLIQIFAQGLGGQIELNRYTVPPGSVIQSLLVGLIITLIAALLPAWRAGSITPVEAMRPHGDRSQGFLIRRGWIIGLGLLAIALLAPDPVWEVLPDASFFIFLFLGGTLLVPVTITLLERGARHLLTFLYGREGGLGSRNLERAKGRTSLTVGVLMVGAVMTIAVGSINVAFKDAVTDWIEMAIGGDLTVQAPRGQRLEFARTLEAVEGVETATPMRITSVRVVGSTNSGGFEEQDDQIGFVVVDLPSYRQVAGFSFTQDADQEEAILARLAEGEAMLVSGIIADLYDLKRGDSIRLRTSRGERDFEVAGVVNLFYWGGRSIVGIWPDMERYLGRSRAWTFLVDLAPGADPEAVKARLEDRLSRYGDYEINSADEFRQNIYDQSQQFFSIFSVIVWISVLVAGLGVVNTMTMNILERVREIGMLRGIGMTRGQVARMVLAEAAAMGIIGGLFGLTIGYLISEDMVQGMNQVGGWNFEYIFPRNAFISSVVIVLVVSQVAALYPLWRAVRVNIVKAMQFE